MSKFELTDLNLAELTPEHRLKITQGIIDDLVRALNLGNYSLIWRYLDQKLSAEIDAAHFAEMHNKIKEGYGSINSFEQKSSALIASTLTEEWLLKTENSADLVLTIRLQTIREFLAIEHFSIKPLFSESS